EDPLALAADRALEPEGQELEVPLDVEPDVAARLGLARRALAEEPVLLDRLAIPVPVVEGDVEVLTVLVVDVRVALPAFLLADVADREPRPVGVELLLESRELHDPEDHLVGAEVRRSLRVGELEAEAFLRQLGGVLDRALAVRARGLARRLALGEPLDLGDDA